MKIKGRHPLSALFLRCEPNNLIIRKKERKMEKSYSTWQCTNHSILYTYVLVGMWNFKFIQAKSAEPACMHIYTYRYCEHFLLYIDIWRLLTANNELIIKALPVAWELPDTRLPPLSSPFLHPWKLPVDRSTGPSPPPHKGRDFFPQNTSNDPFTSPRTERNIATN